MLLAHLLPFLDAEIDRLQRARDLLAYVPAPSESIAATPLHTAEAAPSPASPEIEQPAAAQLAPRVLILKPHRRGAERASRRKTAPVADTALRGAVPAGPIVVSAQAVRQAQENKVSHSGKAIAEAVPAFDWRPRANQAPDVEAQLLRRLLDIGNSKDATPASPSEQLLRFMHS